jgi:hypothetical protein
MVVAEYCYGRCTSHGVHGVRGCLYDMYRLHEIRKRLELDKATFEGIENLKLILLRKRLNEGNSEMLNPY